MLALALVLGSAGQAVYAESDSEPPPAEASGETAPTQPLPPPADSTAKSADDAAMKRVAAETKEANRSAAVTTCSLPEEEEFLGLEWARRTTFRSVCLAAHWVDSLFGEDPFDPKTGRINGHVSITADRRQGGSTEVIPRVRASVKLPNVSRKVDLFFDRDKESQTIVGESDALHPETTKTGEETSSQLGVGYQLHQGLRELMNIRAGIRIRAWKPEPFARSRYDVTFADTGTDRWTFGQTLFWRKGDGFGETSSLDYERHLGGPFILRWGNSATFSEETDGLRWNSGLSVFHAITNDDAMQWSYGGGGETGSVIKLARHGPRVTYRHRMKQRWLVFEAYAGVENIKNDTLPKREARSYVGAKIQASFNPP